MKRLTAYLHLMRPHQYLKNGFVWLPLLFGYRLGDMQALLHTFYAFVVFSLAASSIYIINDLKDIDEDRRHPVKQLRPLPSGRLKPAEALILMAVLLSICVLGSLTLLPRTFLAVITAYFLLNLAYSFHLKHMAIIDVVCIALGFVLRILAGGMAADVVISPWIVIMTFLLALFLALAKRRDDLLLSNSGNSARKSLDGYNMEFVSLSMGVMASVIIVAYILYTVSPAITLKHHTNRLYLSAFWVIVGLLRYMQITFVQERSGSPTMILIKDGVLQAVILSWLVSIYVLLYVKTSLF